MLRAAFHDATVSGDYRQIHTSGQETMVVHAMAKQQERQTLQGPAPEGADVFGRGGD